MIKKRKTSGIQKRLIPSYIFLTIVSLIRIIAGIISIMYSVKLARAFGRGTLFAVGLIFLQPIFMLILGLGDDRYYGADK